MSNTLQLTEQLIAEVSVTPEDANCQAILAKRLEAIGFQCENMPSGPETFRVQNLFALRPASAAKSAQAPVLLFAGHTDVVPTGPIEKWTHDPFTPTHRNGMLYGRGSSDMKASLAAMVVEREPSARQSACGHVPLGAPLAERGQREQSPPLLQRPSGPH